MKYLSLLSLFFAYPVQAFFGCTFSVVHQQRVVYTQHLTPNRAFELFEWNHYLMNLHFEENQSATFRIRDEEDQNYLVSKRAPFDSNPIQLRLVIDGLLFQVACLYSTESTKEELIFTMDEDQDKDEWSTTECQSALPRSPKLGNALTRGLGNR